MHPNFELVITADHPNRTAEFRLLNESGAQLHFHQANFRILPLSRQQALFDLHNFLRHYVQPEDEQTAVAELGVCIAEQVLGEQIFQALWASEARRTLCIWLRRLPACRGRWHALRPIDRRSPSATC